MILTSDVQFSNARSPIVSSGVSGRMTLTSDVQLLKASLPMLRTVLGRHKPFGNIDNINLDFSKEKSNIVYIIDSFICLVCSRRFIYKILKINFQYLFHFVG